MCGCSSEHNAMELRHRAPSERLDQPVPFSERLADKEVCCEEKRQRDKLPERINMVYIQIFFILLFAKIC